MNNNDQETAINVEKAALMRILNDWEPIGRSPAENEYDSLINQILGELHKEVTCDDISSLIRKKLAPLFGIDESNRIVNEVGHSIWNWWVER